MKNDGCCAPPKGEHLAKTQALPPTKQGSDKIDVTLCDIPGGKGLIGTNSPAIEVDEEGPLRTRKITGFRMMATPVTNAQFARFIQDTGYATEAERFGWSFVFYKALSGAAAKTPAVANATWWRRIEGARWCDINGPNTPEAYAEDHPVVHVSWTDAKAYAAWAGGRLPSEAEWEHAARGGQGDVRYPWGDADPGDDGPYPCNIWQGKFPEHNTLADGYGATAPAQSFEPNAYGLYNMCGNVWEWTSTPLKLRSLSARKRSASNKPEGSKILKGGSYLCHASYCFRYRIAARNGTTPDTTTSHQGFRLVF